MDAVDRQRVAGIGGKCSWVGISQSVQRGVIERGLEASQISGRNYLPQRAAIAEIELETAVAEHGEITWQRRRGIVALEPHQCARRIARGRGRFTTAGDSSEEEEHNRDTGQLQVCHHRSVPPGVQRSPPSFYHLHARAVADQCRAAAPDHQGQFKQIHRNSADTGVSGLGMFAQVAMPRGHMQWREGADDLLVEVLSRKIRIGPIAEQQAGRFRETLLDGEMQQPSIWAGGTHQGRVGIQ